MGALPSFLRVMPGSIRYRNLSIYLAEHFPLVITDLLVDTTNILIEHHTKYM